MKRFNLNTRGALSYRASAGKLLKWKSEEFFIKTSSVNYNGIEPSFMYESYSEVIAYSLTKDLGFKRSVQYKPCIITIDDNIETVGCYCENFLNKNESYIDIGKLIEFGKINIPIGVEAYEVLKKTINNKGFSEILDDCILLDYVILNCDRHYGNIGIIRDTVGNIKSAPIFDSGDSLFGSKFIDKMKYNPKLLKYVKSRPFSSDFDVQLSLVKKRLKIDGLHNTNKCLTELSNNWGLTNQRKDFIADLIGSRINNILINGGH